MDHPNVVVIFITNKAGDFFVHKRRDDKKTFPGKYGLGAGGRVEAGEDLTIAAARELIEETGLATPLLMQFHHDYQGETVQYGITLFTTQANKNIRNDASEWEWSGWMTKEEVDELASNDELCPDTLELYQRYINQAAQVRFN